MAGPSVTTPVVVNASTTPTQHAPFPEENADTHLKKMDEEEVPLVLLSDKVKAWWSMYLTRLKGEGKTAPSLRPVASWDPIATMFLCGVTLFILVAIHHWGFVRRGLNLSAIISAFGASCCMVFGASQVHASQPRAVIVGYLIGGLFGISFNNIFARSDNPEIAMRLGAALAVACSLTVMKITSYIHPPGCSAAIFAAYVMSRNQQYHDEGFMFLVTPLLLGSVVIALMGWLGNNAFPWRKHYPSEW